MNKRALLVFGIGLIVAFVILSYLRRGQPRTHHVTGQTMGTIVYNVKYVGDLSERLKVEIDGELKAFNESLSTYIPGSEISRLNDSRNLTFESAYFYPLLQKSKEVFEKTSGAFDPTIGPLVQALGFGSDKEIPSLDSSKVDSLKSLIGFSKVMFDSDEVSIPDNFQIDFSAIAKGYAVDLIALLLDEKNIEHYMVEIGGEVRCKGLNEEGKSWSLGIEDPTVSHNEQRLLAIVRLKNLSLATSGNYRNYYERDGRIYAHIIDPRTGYNAQHSLLSASVFAADCMTADAYATAFMVLGLEESIRVSSLENIDVILVYQDIEGTLKSYVSEGIKPYVELNKTK